MSQSGGFETTEFRRTFSLETDRLLRRRLAWFASIWGGLGILGVVGLVALYLFAESAAIQTVFFGNAGGWKQIFPPVGLFGWLAVYGLALFVVIVRRNLPTQSIVRLSILMITFDGAVSICARIGEVPGYNLSYFWLAHLIACMVFPWTVRQALIPVAIILPLSLVSKNTLENAVLGSSIASTLWVLISLAPGVIICGVRQSQRVQKASNRFLHKRYGMLRQELAYARQVHEALFPEVKPDGDLRFSYKYEPMRQIGGDYLYAKVCDEDGSECINIALIDVTGHGIPAALTVNRLHGEIDLRFAEQPDIGPGELLRVLNRYIALTLAKHSIFATAVCFKINADTGEIRYASGGHPPSFIRGIDGTLRELDPTSFVLGACPDADFDPGERTVEFHEGDSLIAYTDGAIEAKSPEGKMLRMDGLRALLASQPTPGFPGGLGSWSDRILTEVTNFRGGLPPEDDTLAIEVYRAIRVEGDSNGAAREASVQVPVAGA